MSWSRAGWPPNEGVKLLKSGVDGRATFLIHPVEQGGAHLRRAKTPSAAPGLTPLKDSIRVLNGFGRSLESILPKLKHGYVVEDPGEARRLAAQLSLRLFPDAGGRVLPQRDSNRRQAGQRRPAGAQARVARDREPAGANWRPAWRRRRLKRRR